MTIIMVLFIVTVVATDAFGVFSWWQELSVRESRPVYELLEEGYGDKLNLTAIDEDIKITVESILADDIKTVILLEIEDLKQKDLYGTTRDGIEFEGSLEYDADIPEELHGANYSLLTLHSEDPFRRRLLINLQPLTEKESTLFLNIKELESNLVDSDKVVEGNWSFEIPVSVYDVATYDINKELEVEGNILTLETLTIGPTSTLLTYNFQHNQTWEYTLEHFNNVQLFSNGKEYVERFFGGVGSSQSQYANNRKQRTMVIREFDAMYLDKPEEIEVKVGGYGVHVKANAYKSFDIHMDQGFPQEFEYMGSSIIIESINIGEDTTEIIIKESMEDRNYEELEIDFRTEGNAFVYPVQDWQEYYIVDSDGAKVEGNQDNYFYYTMNMKNPTIYTTKSLITLKHSPGRENLPLEVRGPDEIVPSALVIRGYRENRIAEESIKIELE